MENKVLFKMYLDEDIKEDAKEFMELGKKYVLPFGLDNDLYDWITFWAGAIIKDWKDGNVEDYKDMLYLLKNGSNGHSFEEIDIELKKKLYDGKN